MSDDQLANMRVVPSNFGPLREPNGNARIKGPCGDTMEFWVRVEGDRVVQASFTTDGCGHSVLSGSACARLAEGKPLEESLSIDQQDVVDAVGNLPKESHHCALLAATTLRAALSKCAAPPEKETEHDAKDGPPRQAAAPRSALQERLSHIRHKIIVLSGKGGVGKSTVAVHLALSLLHSGRRVGLLDVDLHGPSVPKMLGIERAHVRLEGDSIVPVVQTGLKVMSIAFLLSDRDSAVIWRGPMKANVIEQLLRDVSWGDLDDLVIDCPPGTGDEPLSVCQLVGDADGAVIVTTPQDVATANVRRSIRFCHDLDLSVLGVVENMSGFLCPACGKTTDVFGSGGGERLAAEMGVPFLGRIPLDPAVGKAGDEGFASAKQYQQTAAGLAMERVVERLLAAPDVPPVRTKALERRSK